VVLDEKLLRIGTTIDRGEAGRIWFMEPGYGFKNEKIMAELCFSDAESLFTEIVWRNDERKRSNRYVAGPLFGVKVLTSDGVWRNLR